MVVLSAFKCIGYIIKIKHIREYLIEEISLSNELRKFPDVMLGEKNIFFTKNEIAEINGLSLFTS